MRLQALNYSASSGGGASGDDTGNNRDKHERLFFFLNFVEEKKENEATVHLVEVFESRRPFDEGDILGGFEQLSSIRVSAGAIAIQDAENVANATRGYGIKSQPVV